MDRAARPAPSIRSHFIEDSVSKRRVVVTGLGIVSPVRQCRLPTAWAAVLAGKSGIKPITRIDATPFATRFAGEVEGFDVATYIPPKEARRMDPFMHYGMGAGIQAVADSGLDFTKEDGDALRRHHGLRHWRSRGHRGRSDQLGEDPQPQEDFAVLHPEHHRQHGRRPPEHPLRTAAARTWAW